MTAGSRGREDPQLRLIEGGRVGRGGQLMHGVGIVEHDADVADAPGAGLRAECGLTRFHAGITENALLGVVVFPVEIHLLYGQPDMQKRQERQRVWSVSTMPSSSRL